jgi:SpoVK/Ycf46/Vps4 family AAA+-type ATPase
MPEIEGDLPMDAYRTSSDHVMEELERINLMICAQARKYRKHGKDSQFLGLYISEEEVDSLLAGDNSESTDAPEILKLEEEIEKKKEQCLREGVELRLESFRRLFNLSPLEVDAVLIAMAPELDVKYGKLFAYLQNDVTKKKPTIDLILTLVCKSKEERIDARKHFSNTSSLINNSILHLEDADAPLIERNVKLDDRILGFLLGSDEMDSKIAAFASLRKPAAGSEESTFSESNMELLSRLNELCLSSTPVLILQGSHDVLEIAEALCQKATISLLVADLERMGAEDLENKTGLLFREARLQRASVYLDKFDAASDETRRAVLREAEGFQGLIFVPSKTEPVLKRKAIKVAIPDPSQVSRANLWKSLLGEFDGNDELATKFKFGRKRISAAIESAKNRALLRNPTSPRLTLDDLYEGCKSQTSSIPLTTKIIPRYTWEDIVLPTDKKEQLREICNYVKNHATVFETWGFNKHSLGKGLNIMFSGPSGTGKTMAAEIVAHELKLDMYKIDLSMVVSKYIGETEKNLNRIFKDAEDSNAILFFDEADALFGKRSEVKDSHDRYANIEINYLLQKMEEHESIAILATNLSENVDDAFRRRMNFVVEFPFPDEEYRLAIWKKVFPKETPLADIDYGFLSKLKVTGGNIKNIALTAAFLAAENSDNVTMENIAKAAKREFQKTGKIYGKEEFGKYYDLIV